jgi:hypothetical protein
MHSFRVEELDDRAAVAGDLRLRSADSKRPSALPGIDQGILVGW